MTDSAAEPRPVIVGAPQLSCPFLGLFAAGALLTVVAAVAELFAAFVSSGEPTVAVFESVPRFFALTTIVTVAFAPPFTWPRSHVTVLPVR